MFGFFLMVYSLCGVTCSLVLSRHKRAWIIDSFSIEEGHRGPFPYKLGTIDIEREYRIFFDLYGEGVDKDPKGVLTIHKETGTIYVHKAVDYENKTALQLQFEAKREDFSTDTKLGVEIAILDINDNPPLFQTQLYELTVGEQKAQDPNLLTLAAHDRDRTGSPNSTFHYEIESVSPNPPDTDFFINEYGTLAFQGCSTAGLVREPGVYAGSHTVDLKISDMQGQFAIYNVSVMVCHCSATPVCERTRNAVTKVGFGAAGIAFASLLLLLLLLLMVITISCKKKFANLQIEDENISGETLLTSNIEQPGTDCEVAAQKHTHTSGAQEGVQQTTHVIIKQNFSSKHISDNRREDLSNNGHLNEMTTKTVSGNGYHHNHHNHQNHHHNHHNHHNHQNHHHNHHNHHNHQNHHHNHHNHHNHQNHHHNHHIHHTHHNHHNHHNHQNHQSHHTHHNHQVLGTSMKHSLYKKNSGRMSRAVLSALLHQRLSSLKAKEDLKDYLPQIYRDEGALDHLSELDHISMPDEELDLKNLDSKFNKLASICQPSY
ncbi:hypothetical protein LDENG_00005340 [Lucifuga dentata]|nr:hypothetical protein LDENG_00005340 [Lucifuga dentata]